VLQRGHAFSPPRCGFLTLRTHSAQLLTCTGCWCDPLVELQALRSRTSVTIACTCLSLCFVSYLQAFVRLRFMFFFRLISNFCIAEYYRSLYRAFLSPNQVSPSKSNAFRALASRYCDASWSRSTKFRFHNFRI